MFVLMTILYHKGAKEVSTYWDATVICPYYKRTGEQRLTCEWRGDGEITQRFKDERSMCAYMYDFCAQYNYKLCALCVVNDKYHEGGNG